MMTHARKIIRDEGLPDIELRQYDTRLADSLRGWSLTSWIEIDHAVLLDRELFKVVELHNGRVSS